MSGLFSGELDFITNKTDFDFEIDLYKMTPNGDYVQLAPYWARASFVGDLSHPRLLAPGKRQHLNFPDCLLDEPTARSGQPAGRGWTECGSGSEDLGGGAHSRC
jgi:uncharacterized protein